MLGKRILITLVLLLSAATSFADTCDAPSSSEQARVYFINGWTANRTGIEANAEYLKRILGTKTYSYGYVVNTTAKDTQGFFDLFVQFNSESEDFWYRFRGDKPANGHFYESWAQRMQNSLSKKYTNDADVINMIDSFLRDLNSGKKVVLVAHSQGNFYANTAYQYIRFNYPHFKDSLGIVGVGSVADVEYPNMYHATNSKDNAVKFAKTILGNTPPSPANGTYEDPEDFFNHNFLGTYDETVFPALIRQGVINTVNRLDTPPKDNECKPLEDRNAVIETKEPSNVSDTSAKMNAEVVDSANVSVWFNMENSPTAPESCLSTANNYPNTGNYQIGDKPSMTATGLKAETKYLYRACAKAKNGFVSDGGTREIETDEAPPPIVDCGRTFEGGSEGLSVIYNMDASGPYSPSTGSGVPSPNPIVHTWPMFIRFDAFTIPDAFSITRGVRKSGTPPSGYDDVRNYTFNGTTVSSGGFVQGIHSSNIQYGYTKFLKVTVQGNTDTKTRWNIRIQCPAEIRLGLSSLNEPILLQGTISPEPE